MYVKHYLSIHNHKLTFLASAWKIEQTSAYFVLNATRTNPVKHVKTDCIMRTLWMRFYVFKIELNS